MKLANGKMGSPRWRKAGRPATMPVKEPEPVEPLPPTTNEDLTRSVVPEAIDVIRGIMRKPGRNAGAQLRAAEAILRYGVQEPAKAQTITSTSTQRLEGDINIVLVPAKDGRRS